MCFSSEDQKTVTHILHRRLQAPRWKTYVPGPDAGEESVQAECILKGKGIAPVEKRLGLGKGLLA